LNGRGDPHYFALGIELLQPGDAFAIVDVQEIQLSLRIIDVGCRRLDVIEEVGPVGLTQLDLHGAGVQPVRPRLDVSVVEAAVRLFEVMDRRGDLIVVGNEPPVVLIPIVDIKLVIEEGDGRQGRC
jgi:hypothetical protein